jgi:cysteine desulfurase
VDTFDYNAMAPLRLKVKEGLRQLLDTPLGNPSSAHALGRKGRCLIDEARFSISALLRVSEDAIVFTSGATEANATVLSRFQGTVIRSSLEHESIVLNRPDAHVCPVLPTGILNLNILEDLLQHATPPILLSIIAAHNETGVIQPLEEVCALARRFGAYVHTDAVQALGRHSLDFTQFDYVSLSGHKIGALPGVGALLLSKRAPFSPFLKGGGQEQNRRAGTENIFGIVSFAEALKDSILDDWHFVRRMRDTLETHLRKEGEVVCEQSPRLPNTSMILMPYVNGDAQVLNFDLEGFRVSTGSACSSGKVQRFRSLEALGITSKNALRVSLPLTVTAAQIDSFASLWQTIYQRCHFKRG